MIKFFPHDDWCQCDECSEAWEAALAQAVVIVKQRQREEMQKSYEHMFVQLEQN